MAGGERERGADPGVTDADTPDVSGFLAMLDRNFRDYGVGSGLPAALRDAVQAVPRHRFVHRFRVGDGPLQDADADPAGCRAVIYSDEVMRHLDAAGALLRSSNSQPSYILWLLHRLGVAPGARVLEIGSGSGWLAAIMAQLVGAAGTVTGIEILPDLAAQSRIDLGADSRVRIVTGDGADAPVEGGPFDRAMITAGTWDVPDRLFDLVRPGGAVLVPLELRGSVGCQVTLLRRHADRFVAESSVAGWFVPLVGATQTRDAPPSLPDTPPLTSRPLPLGSFTGLGGQSVAAGFRAFLGRTEPGFALFSAPGERHVRFGLTSGDTTAVWHRGVVSAYGGLDAAERLASAYARWADLGLPNMDAFGLEVIPAGTEPGGDGTIWVEPRGRTSLVWRLPAPGWRTLLRNG